MALNILVAGAGAVGGLLCAYLHAAGHRVSLLARGQNAQQIDALGIRLRTPTLETIHARPNVVCSVAGMGMQDLVIVATKAFSLSEVMAAVAPVIGGSTSVMPVLNGLPWWLGDASAPLRSLDPYGELAVADRRADRAVEARGEVEVALVGAVVPLVEQVILGR